MIFKKAEILIKEKIRSRSSVRNIKISTINCEQPVMINMTEIILPRKCPVCGENRKDGYYEKDNKIVYAGVYETKVNYYGIPFIRPRSTISFYKCLSCGTRWKSEPYSINL